MTNQQPEALRLANKLEPVHSASTPLLDLHREAAVELRRLHAECDNRMQAINGLTKLANGYHDDLMTLREAVKRLHAAKGRYHNQLAACDLFDLLGLKNERPTK
jgi:hypothetical protein